MKFKLKTPCADCPFRTDTPKFFNSYERAYDIVRGMEYRAFPCHKTAHFDDDGEQVTHENTQACAGALIMLEHAGESTNAMRINERLGFYDHTILDMDAPVYTSPYDFALDHDRE